MRLLFSPSFLSKTGKEWTEKGCLGVCSGGVTRVMPFEGRELEKEESDVDRSSDSVPVL